MKAFIPMILIIISCSTNEQKKGLQNTSNKEMSNDQTKDFDINNIENNFIQKTIVHKEDLTKIDRSIAIPYEIMTNIFLYPVNETMYEKSYITSKFYAGYKIKISDNIWILSYLHHYDLHSEEVIWSIYDSKKKQIKSNLVITSWNEGTEKRVHDFDGKKILIITTYHRNFQNGMEGDINKPLEIMESFEITKDYIFKKNK